MKSLEDINAIRERMQGQVGFGNSDTTQTRIVVGIATCGIASGARPVLTALLDAVNTKNLNNVMVTQTGCIGLCQYEPIVEVIMPGQDKVTYVKMTPQKALEVVEKHIEGGTIVSQYTINSVMNG